MKFDATDNWSEDDFEFEREFEREFGDISRVYKARSGQQSAPVPTGLDKRIKALARVQSGETLESHWIFGNVPKVALVVSLLFAIGVALIIAPRHPVTHQVPVWERNTPAPKLDARPNSLNPAEQHRMRQAAEDSASLYRTSISRANFVSAILKVSVTTGTDGKPMKLVVASRCVIAVGRQQCAAPDTIAPGLRSRLDTIALRRAYADPYEPGVETSREITVTAGDLD